MDHLLIQRLDILKESRQITDEIKTAVIDFVHDFEKKYLLSMTEDNASMLITHLAMALARIKRKEKINEMDESALNEIKQNPIFNDLPEFYNNVEEKLKIKIPDSEKGFIAVHVAAVIVNQSGLDKTQ